MLSCKQIVAKSDKFLDRELTFKDRVQYRIHLFMCQHCQRFIKQLALSNKTAAKLDAGHVTEADHHEEAIAEVMANIANRERDAASKQDSEKPD